MLTWQKFNTHKNAKAKRDVRRTVRDEEVFGFPRSALHFDGRLKQAAFCTNFSHPLSVSGGCLKIASETQRLLRSTYVNYVRIFNTQKPMFQTFNLLQSSIT